MTGRPILSMTIAVGILLAIASVCSPQQSNKVGDVMRVKLDHAKQILEGLTLEDYGLISKSAQSLSLLSLATNWEVLQTPEYLEQSKEFQRAADALSKAAEKKNIDAAALAYVDVTMKCVNCHKYVRDRQMARLETAPLKQGPPKAPVGR
jgi:hypothetical protein